MNNLKANILVIEDEKSMREVLRILLEEEDYRVTSVTNGLEGIEALKKELFDLIITDIKMPKADGFEVLSMAKEISPASLVIMITAFGTTEAAIDAMKQGAYDYINKPFKIDEIRLIVNKALEKKKLSEEVSFLREKVLTSFRLENIIGKSARMQELFRLIPRVAQSNSTVLITGESGTGKELVSAALHNLSLRKDRNFLTINCATFPEGLLESELFGHMKGAFTGAVYNKAGLCEAADGGSIFLDEIGEMPLSLQAKLLRVLENGTFRRVGGTSDITVDIRIIAATNKDMATAVSTGTFREDLFYRLNVVPINIPPLRDRKEDIPLLIEHFLNKFSANSKAFSHDAMRALINYPWKGNVRELENLIERILLLSDQESISLDDIPQEILTADYPATNLPDIGDEGINLEKIIEEIEKDYLVTALEKGKGIKTEAARLLGLSFRSFRHRLQKYNIK
ncbi:MAG: sigma-54-dependent Fis family transcriptional regulator [Nitrospiraceae bacterium]|nr:MAG: sigma-54-dependent Fis family transcriptional regulator [Nitrospiraceae bacterium]